MQTFRHVYNTRKITKIQLSRPLSAPYNKFDFLLGQHAVVVSTLLLRILSLSSQSVTGYAAAFRLFAKRVSSKMQPTAFPPKMQVHIYVYHYVK